MLAGEGRFQADPVARRILGLSGTEDDSADLLRQLDEVLDGATDRAFLPRIELRLAGDKLLALSLDVRRLGDRTIVLLWPRDSLAGHLLGEGATSFALQALYRQTAHELRGPVHSSSLQLALLRRAARGELARVDNLEERQLQWIKAIEADLARLTDTVAHWSNLLSDPAEVAVKLELSQALLTLEKMLAPLARRKAIDLEIDFGEQEQLGEQKMFILAPSRRLHRTLAALATASVEALGSGGRLRLALTSQPGLAEIEAFAEAVADHSDTLLPALISQASTSLGSWRGSVELAGRRGWKMSWPLAESEQGEVNG